MTPIHTQGPEYGAFFNGGDVWFSKESIVSLHQFL
jgi:hypothetical protein